MISVVDNKNEIKSEKVYYNKIFKGKISPNWCPGCGDYSLLSATIKSLEKLGFTPNETVIVSGIGCSSNFPHFTTAYGFHTVHGRALPAAMGIHLVNPELKIIVVGGDGDGYGIGIGHFIHAARKNLDITYLVMNNQIYGLTLGQASPTSTVEHITLTTPKGVSDKPINPIALALGAGASFVARGFSGKTKHLEDLIIKAINHRGFSLVDVLSPCVSFNRLNTYEWFNQRIYDLQNNQYITKNIINAFEKAQEWGNQIPIGVFYENHSPTLNNGDPVSSIKNVSKEPLGFKELGISEEEIFNDLR
ncbi:MAG: 2-oxoacid:ferredoxin oxidoreductase subunit beta [Candidatus Hodarchaeales archaeon]|jgi:2-oxoglutarate ferredoxin oxidoreductase subunit beta